nr:hypothetical protein [Klebsiella pneumoniae]
MAFLSLGRLPCIKVDMCLSRVDAKAAGDEKSLFLSSWLTKVVPKVLLAFSAPVSYTHLTLPTSDLV